MDYLECSTPNRPYLLGTSESTKIRFLYRPDCKLWSCPHCANVKQAQWAQRIIGEYNRDTGRDWYFLTYTVKEVTGKLDRQIHIFRSAWDKVSKRMRRTVKRDLTYVLIPELSPVKKRLHAHMLCDYGFGAKPEPGKQKTKWLHDNLYTSGLGYKYDIQWLDTAQRAAYYATKYIGKGLSEVFPSGFRRVRTSQNFFELGETPKDDDILWQFIPCNSTGRRKLLLVYMSGALVWDMEHAQPVDLQHPLFKNKES